MKNQIDKLVELAGRYADFAREVSMPRGKHITLRGNRYEASPPTYLDGWKVGIHLIDDNEDWFVFFFKDMEIRVFSEPMITLDTSQTEESLYVIHDDLETYLEGILIPNKLTIAEHYGKESKKDIEEKINKLKEELKRYENLQG